MTKIMEPDAARQACQLEYGFELPMQVSRLHKCTNTRSEDQIMLLPGIFAAQLVLLLPVLAKSIRQDKGDTLVF